MSIDRHDVISMIDHDHFAINAVVVFNFNDAAVADCQYFGAVFYCDINTAMDRMIQLADDTDLLVNGPCEPVYWGWVKIEFSRYVVRHIFRSYK